MNERYGLEKALEEASILRKKVESGESKSYPEAEEKLENQHCTEISNAIEGGDFKLAVDLQNKYSISKELMDWSILVAFDDCLRSHNHAVAVKILEEFNPSKEKTIERIIYFMSMGLKDGYYQLIFSHYEEHFILTDDMKREAVKKAIETCTDTVRQRRADELAEYFSNLLNQVK